MRGCSEAAGLCGRRVPHRAAPSPHRRSRQEPAPAPRTLATPQSTSRRAGLGDPSITETSLPGAIGSLRFPLEAHRPTVHPLRCSRVRSESSSGRAHRSTRLLQILLLHLC